MSLASRRTVCEWGTHVGNVQVVLRHVEADRNVRKVQNRVQDVPIQDESLDQSNQGERYMAGGENITANVQN